MTDIQDTAHHPTFFKKTTFWVLLPCKGERIKYGILFHGAPLKSLSENLNQALWNVVQKKVGMMDNKWNIKQNDKDHTPFVKIPSLNQMV